LERNDEESFIGSYHEKQTSSNQNFYTNTIAHGKPLAGEPMRYYIFFQDNQYGPATMPEIKEWIADGRIDETTLIWENQTMEWMPLTSFKPYATLAKPVAAPVAARKPVHPEQMKLDGTKLYPKGYTPGTVDRRNYLRLKLPLRMDFSAFDIQSRKKMGMPGSTTIDNISAGGLAFIVGYNKYAVGQHFYMRIYLDEATVIEAICEVVRIQNQSLIGCGFREMKGKQKLIDFLTRSR